jgi:hypothetical protein
MSDVFVSYSDSDRERVIPIIQLLGKQGWTVWWDRNIPPGKVFDRVIEEAIATTKCVLVIWSRASIESDWVKNEASEGVRRGIMIPVLIDNVQIPFEFRRIQAAKLTSLSPDSSGAQELLSSISNLVQRPAPETSATPAVLSPSSYNNRGYLQKYQLTIENLAFSILTITLIAWIIYAPFIHHDWSKSNTLIISIITTIIYLAFPIRPSFAVLSSLGIHMLNIVVGFMASDPTREIVKPAGIGFILLIASINAIFVGLICRWRIAQGLKEGGTATDDTTSRTPIILVSSILVAVGLGSVFSFVYPTVKIDFDLAFLFMLVGLLIVLAIRGMWQAIWHKKK